MLLWKIGEKFALSNRVSTLSSLIVSDISSLLLQFVRVHVGPYQILRTRPVPERSGSPFWNEDLMFVAAEPFDDLMHLIVEDRVGPKVSGQRLLM